MISYDNDFSQTAPENFASPALSIYPDKDTPTASNDFRKVDIVVTVEGLLPVGGGTVSLTEIDPPNASGTGAANNGGALVFTTQTLTFTNGNMEKTSVVTVGLNAGDNYIVKATPDNNTPSMQSEILTVWRRLWMELDQMDTPDYRTGPDYDGFDPNSEYAGNILDAGGNPIVGLWATYPIGGEPPDFDVAVQPPKPDISLLAAAMIDACVTVKESEWNTRPTTSFVHNIDVGSNSSYQDISNPCRDITLAQVSPTFWSVHGIGAYEDEKNENGTFGVATLMSDGGSFYVFYENIRDIVTNYTPPVEHPDRTYVEGITGKWARTTYHETMHYFGFYDVYDVDEILSALQEFLAIFQDYVSLDDLWSLLESYNGNVYEFIANEYPQYANLLVLTADDPDQGIMCYATGSFGTWEEIKLKTHQIAQIQSLTQPIPLG